MYSKKAAPVTAIISIIGAILIGLGIAWIIGVNWHYLPNPLKILILFTATLSAVVFGIFLRHRGHEGVARGLLLLGALLYVLSVVLLFQMYNLNPGRLSERILRLSWPVILLLAYLLYSPEDLILGLGLFFFWIIIEVGYDFDNISMLITLITAGGVLMYGLTAFHEFLNHRFGRIYRFWTAVYFFSVFYLLSFQSLILHLAFPRLDFFPVPFIFFILFSFFVFLLGSVLSASKGLINLKEILAVVGIVGLLLVMVFLPVLGRSSIGVCYLKNCGDFKTKAECMSAPGELNCNWVEKANKNSYCVENLSFNVRGKLYDRCRIYDNQKSECLSNDFCGWKESYSSYSRKLPTLLLLLWIFYNFIFIGFILLIIVYAKRIGSTKIINLALAFFVLEIVTRYIGFWMDYSGYFMFGLLSILGGVLLILGVWLLPKWRRRLIKETKRSSSQPIEQPQPLQNG